MKQTVCLLAVGASIFCASQASAACRLHQDIATVCVGTQDGDLDCETTIYETWICTDGGGGGTGGGTSPPSRPPNPGEPVSTPLDQNGNGVVDSWQGVLTTVDPCSQNFDTNDRLGATYGGPNGVRSGHSGMDIQANDGDPVFSMKTGTVTFVGLSGQCGWAVVVEHGDGSSATYCHLQTSSNVVTWSDMVFAGQNIARANSTGNSTGHHLHLTYRDANNVRREFAWHTDAGPNSSQLNPGGC